MDKKVSLILEVMIWFGLIFGMLFGGLYLYRHYNMDNEPLCGVEEKEICTEETTNLYGCISLIAFLYLFIGTLFTFMFEYLLSRENVSK